MDLTPWLLCFGVFVALPVLAFVCGVYVGRHGMPVEIRIRRHPPKNLCGDGYGVAAEVEP